MKNPITVSVVINAPLDKVWNYWTNPEHIINWNFASDDWCCPKAINNAITGGKFNWRMEAKDGSVGFDFFGQYDLVIDHERIEYEMGDGRKVEITFREKEGQVILDETFETEDANSAEMQRAGWQAILENFTKLVEG